MMQTSLEIFEDPKRNTSDLKCGYDGHEFTGFSFPVVTEYDMNLNKFKVMGHFCSPNCAKRYQLNMKNTNLDNILYQTKFLQDLESLNKGTYLPAAPRQSFWKLKAFGGDMSIDEFRAS